MGIECADSSHNTTFNFKQQILTENVFSSDTTETVSIVRARSQHSATIKPTTVTTSTEIYIRTNRTISTNTHVVLFLQILYLLFARLIFDWFSAIFQLAI